MINFLVNRKKYPISDIIIVNTNYFNVFYVITIIG